MCHLVKNPHSGIENREIKIQFFKIRRSPKAKWRGSGAGAGDSSAVREASKGVKGSVGAHPCLPCQRASCVTAVAGTRPCCACPGCGSRQGARIPATTRGGRAGGPALERPPLAGGLARRFRQGRSARLGPCVELGAGLAWCAAPGFRFFREKLRCKSLGIELDS